MGGTSPSLQVLQYAKKIRPAPASRLTSSVASFASASRQSSHLLSSRVAALWHSFGLWPWLVDGHSHLCSVIYELRLSKWIPGVIVPTITQMLDCHMQREPAKRTGV